MADGCAVRQPKRGELGEGGREEEEDGWGMKKNR